MASVKRFPGSKKWYACYKSPTGRVDDSGRPIFKRVQESTGLTEKDRALQLAISKEQASVLVSEKRWTEQSAFHFLAKIAAISDVHVAQVERTDQFLERWLKSKQRNVAPKSFQNFTGIVTDFLNWLGGRRTAPLMEITPRVIADFRDAEVTRGKAGTTVNKALAVLGQAFEEAVVQEALQRNPTRGLRIKKADRSAQKRTPFTFDQFLELFHRTAPGAKSKRGREVHPDWQTFILATGYTGGRQQEVAKLEWENVDLANRTIGLRRSKTGDVHTMPMHSALHSHLKSRKEDDKRGAGEFVMPHIAGTAERKISKIFRETILPRVGISQPYAERSDEKGVGRKLASYSVHSLRHSLSTWLNRAGVDEMMRMRLVGHEDKDVSRGYTHSELSEAAAELEKVPSVSVKPPRRSRTQARSGEPVQAQRGIRLTADRQKGADARAAAQ